MSAPTRRDELAGGIGAVRRRIDAACTAAARDPREITLVVVTKTYPADDVLLLAELGELNPGENRHPEGARKAAACAEALQRSGGPQLSWHFVGALQTNKAAAVAGYASWVHSVDRLRLVRALDKGAGTAERIVDLPRADRGQGRQFPRRRDGQHLDAVGPLAEEFLGDDGREVRLVRTEYTSGSRRSGDPAVHGDQKVS